MRQNVTERQVAGMCRGLPQSIGCQFTANQHPTDVTEHIRPAACAIRHELPRIFYNLVFVFLAVAIALKAFGYTCCHTSLPQAVFYLNRFTRVRLTGLQYSVISRCLL